MYLDEHQLNVRCNKIASTMFSLPERLFDSIPFNLLEIFSLCDDEDDEDENDELTRNGGGGLKINECFYIRTEANSLIT